jgi:hypothetical protein
LTPPVTDEKSLHFHLELIIKENRKTKKSPISDPISPKEIMYLAVFWFSQSNREE